MNDKDNGPWITLTQCGGGGFDADGALVQVLCVSRFCLKWVPLIEGRIAPHTTAVSGAGRCPWIGTRVVDDRADSDSRLYYTEPVGDSDDPYDTTDLP
ncbi:hypothetical protein [Nocardia callitridis]|uniref:Uncharacterized protein n=1 Tax=Nocardia callitridis TaxID=648753 RepID=A0ABP9JVG3_9NOCA